MALNDTKTSAATELADGNSSAATEHTEEPQLAEIVNQEAGSSTAIELKVVRNTRVLLLLACLVFWAPVPLSS